MAAGFGFASCLILSLTVAWNVLSGPGGTTIGFAQVIQSVNKISTVQYLQVGFAGQQNGSFAAMTQNAIEARIKSLDAERTSNSTAQERKREIDAELTVLNESLKPQSPAILSLAWCRATRDKVRSEVFAPYLGVMIQDGAKCMLIDQATRTVSQVNQKVFDQEGNPLAATSDFFELFKLPAELVSNMGEKVVDGKPAIGYQQTTDALGSTVTWWTEKSSSLPLRIEIRNCLTKDVVASEMVYRDIIYNAKLAADLFDTETPKDFTINQRDEVFHFNR